MSEWAGAERRKHPRIPCEPNECPYWDESNLERIAERAAGVALERVYATIGRSIVTKFLWLCGAACLAVVAWLNGRGIFTP